MDGDVGEPALRALHGPQNFLKSRYPPLWLVWEMENETVKNWGGGCRSRCEFRDPSFEHDGRNRARGSKIFWIREKNVVRRSCCNLGAGGAGAGLAEGGLVID